LENKKKNEPRMELGKKETEEFGNRPLLGYKMELLHKEITKQIIGANGLVIFFFRVSSEFHPWLKLFEVTTHANPP
jgi:hypothetical protein